MKDVLVAEALAIAVMIPAVLVGTALGRWIFG